MLEIAANRTLQIRSETISYFNDGIASTILYASDLHLSSRTDHIVTQVVNAVSSTQPDIMLLGGDMVDSQAGLAYLANCICRINHFCPVWAVSGNHETYVGVEIVKQCVEASGGVWLDGRSCLLRAGKIQIDGFCRPTIPHCAFSILCAHDPACFPQAAQAGYSLVLAGHLHGSQCVVYQKGDLLYPGALFFRWNGNQFQQGQTRMMVSRGVNDTLPIRWNCSREVIVCKIV